jgi:signal transduction histidine kinase
MILDAVRRHRVVVEIATGVLVIALIFVLTQMIPEQVRSRRAVPAFTGLDAALTVLSVTGLLFRRHWPAAVLGVTTVLSVVAYGSGHVLNPTQLCLAVAMGVFALGVPRRRTVVMAAVISAALVATGLIRWSVDWGAGGPLDAVLWVWVGASVGIAVRSRRLLIRALEQRAEKAEAAQEEFALRRVAEDRVSIAREIHDVIAHHVSVINVQAAVAGHVMDTDPDTARTAVRQVREAAATVLEELQSVLGILRQENTLVPIDPAPGRDGLDDLLDSARALDTPVSVHGSTRLDDLGPTGSLSAYRLVQEALTNANKHAPGAPVTMTLRRTADTVQVSVVNGPGRRPPAPVDPGRTGFGLLGMAERVTAAGGRLHTESRDDGGFEVHADFPRARTTQEAPR